MEPTESFHQRRLVSDLVVEKFKSSSDAEVKQSLFWRCRRKDTEFCEYIRRLLQNPLFRSFMISVISLNGVLLVLETDYDFMHNFYAYLEVADLIILSIYTMEILLQLYVDPLNYWRSGYHLFDFILLVIAYLPYTIDKNDVRHYRTWSIINGFQALKILKLISYSRDMRVDGWTDLQNELDQHGFKSSRAFTIVFILLGFFVFFNISIGVVIMNIQDSTQNYERELKAEKQAALQAKKQALLQRQQEEVNMLIHQQKTSEYKTFSELVEDFKKTLHHSDPMVLEDFCASIPFIDLYVTSLDLQDDTVYRLQELYHELVGTLNSILEDIREKSMVAPETDLKS
ncbi:cation channel sperm-associated protein 3 isoform X2 [Pelodiscus sinensis]|uniref:cation channel sperm-associated protein 3 isoform X2 n=1 Tax=Pelodiscus sinensis TaxID=13735 RepID=UPI000D722CD2|nr:cation channel sperm-associated protein 3 isoform X2 [Pelodiscus sinensis]|eukprot:XP_025036992.1 cation channel sperm-associated protein 3 isoform X2 [Pelodiscus sinensis]